MKIEIKEDEEVFICIHKKGAVIDNNRPDSEEHLLGPIVIEVIEYEED